MALESLNQYELAQRFLHNLDRYRDATLWVYFCQTFTDPEASTHPSFNTRLMELQDRLHKKYCDLETAMVKEFVKHLTKDEIIEWINACEALSPRAKP